VLSGDRRVRRPVWGATPRLGQLPRRELYSAVSEPGGYSTVQDLSDRRRQQQTLAACRGDPRRDRLSPHPQRLVEAIRFVAARTIELARLDRRSEWLHLRLMIVLGIETSCDETAAAVVCDTPQTHIRANLIRAQLPEHQAYGGVVPEIAARAHLDHIEELIRR